MLPIEEMVRFLFASSTSWSWSLGTSLGGAAPPGASEVVARSSDRDVFEAGGGGDNGTLPGLCLPASPGPACRVDPCLPALGDCQTPER